MFALQAHTIFVALAGSHAHGTARDDSDVDVRGVCVAPLSVRLSLFDTFEQYDGKLQGELAELILPHIVAHPTASRGLQVKTECVVFDIAKFLGLCAAANPNALEILFADPRDWLYDGPSWLKLYGERHSFLTKKVQQTYLGYAMAQLKRIKTHRSWLLNPPGRKPCRHDFGLPDAGTLNRDDQNRIERAIAEKVRSYGIDNVEMPKSTRVAIQERIQAFWKDALSATEVENESRIRAVATQSLNLPAEVVAALDAEKKYRAATKQWESYQTWKAQRNPARAELEQRHGYDTKHAMHLIRLMRMGLEVLRVGDLLVRRPDAEELNAIRDGAMSFEELLDAASALQGEIQRAAEVTQLLPDVAHDHVDRLALELMRR
jgi:hypothetical protein